ncbi:hypothetical protein M8J76_015493 [Diaphorina citri]|nr:hypothetical protein M8J76_012045 [Diaphorina citri]KAI5737658.1 hypothetical protein M8J76_015493 [Diaphorina citri]
MILVFLATVLAVYICKYYWTHRKLFLYAWSIPGPLALPLLGNLVNFRTWKTALFKDYLSFYLRYGGIYRIWAGHNLLVVITDPDMAETLFNLKAEVFPKPVFFDFFSVMFGQSIFFQGDYSAWKKHRKVLNRVFQTGPMTKLIPHLHEKVLDYSERLMTVPCIQRVDEMLYPWQCDVITHTLFGLKFKPTEIDLICYVNKQFFKLFRESIKSVLTQIKCLERFTAFQSKKTILETVTKMGMVNFFVTGHSDHRDSTLDDIKLADLQEELGEAHLDELGLFNIAGIETLTTAFSAVIFLLSMHPEVQAKVYDELISIMGEDFHKKPSLSELENLKYLDMVIKESLRLYPPAYVAPRRATEDIHIEEFTIPKGASILINVAGIHRQPQYYSQPDKFIPERFSPEEYINRPRNIFVPFGIGPRKCIGQKFALLHMKTAFSVLIRRFEFLPSEKYERIEDCLTAFRFVIEFKHGCFVKFRPRV